MIGDSVSGISRPTATSERRINFQALRAWTSERRRGGKDGVAASLATEATIVHSVHGVELPFDNTIRTTNCFLGHEAVLKQREDRVGQL
jgi:hypothetical protein